MDSIGVPRARSRQASNERTSLARAARTWGSPDGPSAPLFQDRF